jgi:hypothetical protein
MKFVAEDVAAAKGARSPAEKIANDEGRIFSS